MAKKLPPRRKAGCEKLLVMHTENTFKWYVNLAPIHRCCYVVGHAGGEAISVIVFKRRWNSNALSTRVKLNDGFVIQTREVYSNQSHWQWKFRRQLFPGRHNSFSSPWVQCHWKFSVRNDNSKKGYVPWTTALWTRDMKQCRNQSTFIINSSSSKEHGSAGQSRGKAKRKMPPAPLAFSSLELRKVGETYSKVGMAEETLGILEAKYEQRDLNCEQNTMAWITSALCLPS